MIALDEERISKVLASNNAEEILRTSALLWSNEEIFELWSRAFKLYENDSNIRSMAAYHLGYLYRNGKGVNLDKKKALEWYTHAANYSGCFQIMAMRIVAQMYLSGEGVNVDIEKAVHWLKKAELNGYILSDQEKANLSQKLTPTSLQIQSIQHKNINENAVEQLWEILAKSKNVVFFGGAGVSTESGIPDFRSDKGIYSEKYHTNLAPEQIFSHTFFIENTELFYQFYRDKMLYPNAKPNASHKALAELEQRDILKAVVTQNIDGLHQLAGSQKVYELHGSAHRNYCIKCKAAYSMNYILENLPIPLCKKCGELVKPSVVLYEESLDMDVTSRAISAIKQADTLIIGGTSLIVYPAADMIDFFHGQNLVIINKSATKSDSKANLVVHDSIGYVLSEAVKLLS